MSSKEKKNTNKIVVNSLNGGIYTVFYLKEAFIYIEIFKEYFFSIQERKIAWHKITQTDVSTQKNVFRAFRYKKIYIQRRKT